MFCVQTVLSDVWPADTQSDEEAILLQPDRDPCAWQGQSLRASATLGDISHIQSLKDPRIPMYSEPRHYSAADIITPALSRTIPHQAS